MFKLVLWTLSKILFWKQSRSRFICSLEIKLWPTSSSLRRSGMLPKGSKQVAKRSTPIVRKLTLTTRAQKHLCKHFRSPQTKFKTAFMWQCVTLSLKPNLTERILVFSRVATALCLPSKKTPAVVSGECDQSNRTSQTAQLFCTSANFYHYQRGHKEAGERYVEERPRPVGKFSGFHPWFRASLETVNSFSPHSWYQQRGCIMLALLI